MCFVKHIVFTPLLASCDDRSWKCGSKRWRTTQRWLSVVERTLCNTQGTLGRVGSYAGRSSQLRNGITSLQCLIACWFKPQWQAFSAGQTEGEIFSPQGCFLRKPRLFHTCWFRISNAVRLAPRIPLKGLLFGHDMALWQTEIILNQICFSLFDYVL